MLFYLLIYYFFHYGLLCTGADACENEATFPMGKIYLVQYIFFLYRHMCVCVCVLCCEFVITILVEITSDLLQNMMEMQILIPLR